MLSIASCVRDSLADYAHGAWSGWMKYMFGQSVKNEDGTVTIPKSLVDRWERQAYTLFKDLPEQEIEADYDEADKIIEVILRFN